MINFFLPPILRGLLLFYDGKCDIFEKIINNVASFSYKLGYYRKNMRQNERFLRKSRIILPLSQIFSQIMASAEEVFAYLSHLII